MRPLFGFDDATHGEPPGGAEERPRSYRERSAGARAAASRSRGAGSP